MSAPPELCRAIAASLADAAGREEDAVPDEGEPGTYKDRLILEKKLFSRAAKANVNAAADLPERTEKALVARMLGDLGLARRSGALTMGFDNVLRALEGPKPPKVLIEAFDGSPDGKRKLYAAAHRLEGAGHR